MAPRGTDPRRAVAADCAGLTALCLASKASNGYDAAFMAACQDELTVTPAFLDRATLWLIDGDAGPLACIALSPTDDPTTGEVGLCFTAPGAQGRGLGRRLFATLLTEAQGRGFARLTLDADPFAVPFYEKLGFAVTGQTPSGSIPGRSLPVMTRSV